MKEYTVRIFKIGDFQDNFGNTWCDVVFEGEGEPVKWVLKDPTKVSEGDKVTGDIQEKTSKHGKAYLRFYKEQQDTRPAPKVKGQSDEYWAEKDLTIRAQWAIGQSIQLHIAVTANGGKEAQSIETTANELFQMVPRIVAGESEQSKIEEGDLDIINLSEVSY